MLVLLVVPFAKLVCHPFLLPFPGHAILLALVPQLLLLPVLGVLEILVTAHWPNLVVVVELPWRIYPRDRWGSFVVEPTILEDMIYGTSDHILEAAW